MRIGINPARAGFQDAGEASGETARSVDERPGSSGRGFRVKPTRCAAIASCPLLADGALAGVYRQISERKPAAYVGCSVRGFVVLGVGKVTVASTMVRETADRQLGASGEVNTPTGRRIMQMVMRIESQADARQLGSGCHALLALRAAGTRPASAEQEASRCRLSLRTRVPRGQSEKASRVRHGDDGQGIPGTSVSSVALAINSRMPPGETNAASRPIASHRSPRGRS